VRLALDPGRYLVRKPEGLFVRVGEVAVMPSSLAVLDEAEMEQVPYMEVARRGTGPVRAFVLELGATLGTGIVAGAELTPRVGPALQREHGPWTFGLGLELGYTAFGARELAASQRELWASAEARLRYPLWWMLPYVGLRASAGLIHQSFTREREREIRDVLLAPPVPDRDGLAGQLLLLGGLELPLAARLMLRLDAGVGATAARGDAGWSLQPTIVSRIAGGHRF
jgi:hypothetical protein